MIEVFKKVYNALGSGYTENIYQNAIKKELRDRNIEFYTEQTIDILYKGSSIGTFRPDLIIKDVNQERHILVELKVADKYNDEFAVQCLMYLRALAQGQTAFNVISSALLVIFPRTNNEMLMFEFKTHIKDGHKRITRNVVI